MFPQACPLHRGATSPGGWGIATAVMAFILAAALLAPSSLSAASPAPVVLLQQAVDTIPLAPIEVRILRTPILQNAAPLAVSVLTEEDLQRGRSGFFIEEALQGLPGVQVQNRFNPAVGERVAIRGFGAQATFGLRGIRVVVDGIPATLPDGQSSLDHLDVGSLGRVEAIRGPASALFGNASGGVLSFTTRDPPDTPYNIEVMGVTGSDGLRRSQLTASGTVNETGYLVTVSGQTWDGYRVVAPSDTRPRADTVCASGANAGGLDDRTGCYGGSDRLGLNARVTTPLAGGQLALTANVLDLDAENAGSKVADTDDFREINDLYLRFRTGKTLEQQQGGIRWTGPLGTLEGDFSVYGVHRTINNPIPFDVIDLSRKGGGARAQLGSTISTGLGDLQWLGGVEYELQKDDRSEIAAGFGSGLPAPGATPFQDQAEDVRSYGVFLQGTLELPGGAIALAGLRYDNHDFTVEDRVPVTEDNADDSGSRTMDALSPSLGISFPVGESVNLFGSVGTVFNTPTTSQLGNREDAAGGFNPNLDPLRGESYELGIRGTVGSNAAFEVTGYQTNLRDELIRFEVPDFEDVSFFRNVGESRHRGIEATLSVASTDGLFRGDVTYTHTDAKFLEYTVGDDDFSGNRIPGVAPYRAQARLRVSPSYWWVEVVASHVSEVHVIDANRRDGMRIVAPSYELVNLRVGLEEIALGGINVSPWVALINALDEDYIASIAVNAFGGRFFEPGPNQSFQVGLRARFGG